MSDKPKRKNDHCPKCEYGMLNSYTEYDQCDVCYIAFDKLTREPLHDITFLGSYNRLRVSIDELKHTVDHELRLAPRLR